MIKRLLLAIVFFFPGLLHAKPWTPIGPIPYRNQHPILLQFASLTPSTATTLQFGEIRPSITTAYSSVYNVDGGLNMTENLDMEILRTAFKLDAGLPQGLEAGIEVPFMRMDGGFLDGLIEAFHKAFGLPNAGRERVGDDQFSSIITQNGRTLYQYGESAWQLSDISLQLKGQFLEEGDRRPAASWMFTFKLPTGKPSRGTGSGSVDYGLGASVQKTLGRFHTILNTQYFVSGGQPNLNDHLYYQYMVWSLAEEISITRHLSAVIQGVGSTPILKDMGNDRWDGPPIDMVVGLQGRYPGLVRGGDLLWRLAFSEDVNVDGPSVDFTALLDVGITWDLFAHKRYRGDTWARR